MASTIDAKPRRTGAPKPVRRARRRLDAAGSGGPLYAQVVHALRDEIVRGVYPVGSRLPTEGELCERFSVSRHTVREALRRLRDDQLVSPRQGAGTTVVPPRAAESYVHEVTEISDLVTFATGARFVIDTMEVTEADATLARRIGGAPGQRWLAVRGFRYTDESAPPLCQTEVFIDGDFAAVGRLLPRHRGPIFPLIEDLFGQRIGEVHQEISASAASGDLAAGLQVRPGAMVLEVQRTYRLNSGKIAQVAINTHPAERFRHSMTMRRVRG
jgi:DNA-binding GntR family transcriptional regulator